MKTCDKIFNEAINAHYNEAKKLIRKICALKETGNPKLQIAEGVALKIMFQELGPWDNRNVFHILDHKPIPMLEVVNEMGNGPYDDWTMGYVEVNEVGIDEHDNVFVRAGDWSFCGTDMTFSNIYNVVYELENIYEKMVKDTKGGSERYVLDDESLA